MPLTRRAFLASSAAALSLAACGSEKPKPIAVADAFKLDGIGMGEAVKRGDVSPAELVEQTIQLIETLNPRLNFMAATGYEAARTAALGPLPEGPFKGVPYLIKDLTEYPGLPFRLGARLFKDQVGASRPELIARQEASGLVVVGKTTTPEFGLTASTESLLWGPTRNPWNLDHSPGGSSGGAAVAVAAGVVPFAHAGDGGGSIRIPASMCGLFGFKPSRGRVPMPSQAPFFGSEHCISRSVRDSAMLLSLTEQTGEGARHPPAGLITEPGTRRLKIAVTMKAADGVIVDPDVATALQDAATLCRELGHEVIEADLPMDQMLFREHFITLWSAMAFEIASGYASRSGRWPDSEQLEPWTLGLAGHFQARGLEGYAMARDYAETFAGDIAGFFAQYDAVLTPVTSAPAPRIGDLAPTLAFDEHMARVMAFAAFTPFANLAGLPAMSVPLAMSGAGLPIGVQFAAGSGNDALLLALALELERARPWADVRPSLAA